MYILNDVSVTIKIVQYLYQNETVICPHNYISKRIT